jgi:hypothetical protein
MNNRSNGFSVSKPIMGGSVMENGFCNWRFKVSLQSTEAVDHRLMCDSGAMTTIHLFDRDLIILVALLRN